MGSIFGHIFGTASGLYDYRHPTDHNTLSNLSAINIMNIPGVLSEYDSNYFPVRTTMEPSRNLKSLGTHSAKEIQYEICKSDRGTPGGMRSNSRHFVHQAVGWPSKLAFLSYPTRCQLAR